LAPKFLQRNINLAADLHDEARRRAWQLPPERADGRSRNIYATDELTRQLQTGLCTAELPYFKTFLSITEQR
jgi:hypothetical protein